MTGLGCVYLDTLSGATDCDLCDHMMRFPLVDRPVVQSEAIVSESPRRNATIECAVCPSSYDVIT